MRFESRELRPYAESIDENTLSVGSEYFTVHFLDDAMKIPEIFTLVFVGKTRRAERAFNEINIYEDGDVFVFQNAASYFGVDGFVGRKYFTFTRDELAGVYMFEAALDVLLRCSLNRRQI